MWDDKPIPDSREYFCIQKIPRHATPPPTPTAYTSDPILQPHQGAPASSHQHQLQVPQELELKEFDILDDIPDLLDVVKEVMFDFDAWARDVLSYQFDGVTIKALSKIL